MAKNNLKISVILRSKNEERWVGHCIQSILDNFTNPEIINIDNQSTDDTAQIIKNFRKDNNLISDDPRYTKIIFERDQSISCFDNTLLKCWERTSKNSDLLLSKSCK